MRFELPQGYFKVSEFLFLIGLLNDNSNLGLSGYLRSKKLIRSLSADFGIEDNYCLLKLNFVLETDNISSCMNLIKGAVYAYLEFLMFACVQPVYEAYRGRFKRYFDERVYRPSLSFVTMLSRRMQHHDQINILACFSLLSDFSAVSFKEVLKKVLGARNIGVLEGSSESGSPATIGVLEPFYNLVYSVVDCAAIRPNIGDFCLPEDNHVYRDYTGDVSETVHSVYNSNYMRGDLIYDKGSYTGMGTVIVKLNCEIKGEEYLGYMLHTKVAIRTFVEDHRAEHMLENVTIQESTTSTGVTICVSGFADKVPHYVKLLLGHYLRNVDTTTALNDAKNSIGGICRKMLYRRPADQISTVINEKVLGIKYARIAKQLKDEIPMKIITACYLRVLAFGCHTMKNVDLEKIREYFGTRDRYTHEWNWDCILAENGCSDKGNAVSVFFKVPCGLDGVVRNDLLQNIANEHFVTMVGMKDMYGYFVFVRTSRILGQRYLNFGIQSDKDCETIVARIMQFIRVDLPAYILSLSDSQFLTVKLALRTAYLKKLKDSREMAFHLWETAGYWDFNAKEDIVKADYAMEVCKEFLTLVPEDGKVVMIRKRGTDPAVI